MKILLVESNPYQIEWAQEQLANYDLRFATNGNEGHSLLFHECTKNDLVISSLELANHPSDVPTFFKARQELLMTHGFDFFRCQLLDRLIKGEARGIAFLSDYWGSAADEENYGVYHNFERAVRVLEKVGKAVDWTRTRKYTLNCVIITASLLDIEPVLLFQGERLNRQEVEKRFCLEKNLMKRIPNEYLRNWKSQGGIRLKPYREAVEMLLA